MILDVNDLSVSVNRSLSVILNNLCFQVRENECLGILGESGSGKSICWKSMVGMLDKQFTVSGNVNFKGKDLLNPGVNEKQLMRGKDISIIVQNPMTAFDPLFTMGAQMIETFQAHERIGKKAAISRAEDILVRMKIDQPALVLGKHPHELSGGMVQRIMIGLALAFNPSLIIADEPTTAIDTINQVEILKEFELLKKNHNLSMIFISHDLSVLARIADRILVFSDGFIVERGSVDKILHRPEHEATKFLVENRVRLLDQFQKFTGKGR